MSEVTQQSKPWLSKVCPVCTRPVENPGNQRFMVCIECYLSPAHLSLRGRLADIVEVLEEI